MKHTATETLKFKRLVRELRTELGQLPIDFETIAVGVLERLWHATIRDAKDGRIGAKYERDDIAEAVGWHGDSEVLCAVLVTSEWLDVDSDGTLVVHDWLEHAPSFVKAVNSPKHNAPHKRKVPPSEPPSEPPSGAPSEPPSGPPSQPPPNITKHNITKPSSSNEEEGSSWTWEKAKRVLQSCGLNAWSTAIRNARDNNLTPTDIRAIYEHWERQPTDKGALHWRLSNGLPGQPPEEGWPAKEEVEQHRNRGAPDPEVAKEARRSQQVKKARAAYNANPCDETRQALIDLDVPIPEVAK